jgi:hypothetical protein
MCHSSNPNSNLASGSFANLRMATARRSQGVRRMNPDSVAQHILTNERRTFPYQVRNSYPPSAVGIREIIVVSLDASLQLDTSKERGFRLKVNHLRWCGGFRGRCTNDRYLEHGSHSVVGGGAISWIPTMTVAAEGHAESSYGLRSHKRPRRPL